MGLPQLAITDVWPRRQSGTNLVTWPCPCLSGPVVQLRACTGNSGRLTPTLTGLVPELVKLVPGVKQGLARLNALFDTLARVNRNLKDIHDRLASSEEGANRSLTEIRDRLASFEESATRSLKEIHDRIAQLENAVTTQAKPITETTRPSGAVLPWPLVLALALVVTGVVALAIVVVVLR